jgi:threonylcarbamoyladenosine tRNA methylthiotransferase MtaB
MKIAIFTIGCKVNQYESNALASLFRKEGHEIISEIKRANICLVNTCTVTHRADYDSRHLLRQIIKKNPKAICVATGCYVQAAHRRMAQIKGIDYLIGNKEKAEIIGLLPHLKKQSIPQILVSKNPTTLSSLYGFPPCWPNTNRTRAFLKIQDGCDSFCSYCVVPYVRGRVRSLPVEEVIKRVYFLQNQGVKEIVLCGIHLGEYGKDLCPALSLEGLLRKLKKEAITMRLRLSSLNPSEITPDLINFLKTWPTLCPHLHFSLQSGSDKVLRQMGRSMYNASMFKEIVLDLKKGLPQLAIGVDLIVGFPAETENDFAQTYNLIKELPISYCHLFSYSERIGTKSKKIKKKVPKEVIKKRISILKELDQEKRKGFFKENLGTIVYVLVEKNLNNLSKGHSENYIYVHIREKNQINEIIPVKIINYLDNRVYGERL